MWQWHRFVASIFCGPTLKSQNLIAWFDKRRRAERHYRNLLSESSNRARSYPAPVLRGESGMSMIYPFQPLRRAFVSQSDR